MSCIGALAYDDDIVLITHKINATCKPPVFFDGFAAQYDIVLKSKKSKFLVIASHRRRSLYNDMYACSFT